MVTVFVDTSALFALVDRSDHRSRDAMQWLSDAVGKVQLASTNYVLVETYALVERRLGREAVKHLRGKVVPLLQTSWITRDQHERALEAHFTASRGSSFVDQTSFVAMRDAGVITAFALDGDFASAGFGTVP